MAENTKREETFTAAIPELDGIIFDMANTRKGGHFDASKNSIAGYITKEFRCGGDIGHTIYNLRRLQSPLLRSPRNQPDLTLTALDTSMVNHKKYTKFT